MGARCGVALATALVASGCGNASTAPSSAAASVPDCSASKSIKDLAVYAIALSTRGRVCWQVPLSVPAEGTHTSAEPFAAGGRAFFSSDGEVRAASAATGRREWTWSAAGSRPRAVSVVVAAGDTLVATKDGSLVGLDVRKGSVRWERPGPPGGSPWPLPTGDGGVLYTLYSGEVSQVVDSTDGRVRWQGPKAPTPGGLGATPVAAVVSGPAIVGDAAVSTLTSGGVAAVSLRSGSELWRSADPVLKATAVGGVVMLTPPPGPSGAYEVKTSAVDPTSGRPLWSGPFDAGGFSDVRGAVVYQDFARNPTLARLDAGTGQELWRVTTRPWRTVASGDQLVGVESIDGNGPTTVVSRDLTTGALLWQTPAPFTAQNTNFRLLPVHGPAADVVVLVHGNDLTAYDATSGTVAWRFTLPPSALLDGIAVIDGGGLVLEASGCKYRVVSRSSEPCQGR